MNKGQSTVMLIVALSCVGVLADAALKLAGTHRHGIVNKWLFIGLALSCSFAMGWVFLMRVMKIATAGVMYGLVSALLLCLIGVFWFEEKLSAGEVAGIATAAVAILLLGSSERAR